MTVTVVPGAAWVADTDKVYAPVPLWPEVPCVLPDGLREREKNEAAASEQAQHPTALLYHMQEAYHVPAASRIVRPSSHRSREIRGTQKEQQSHREVEGAHLGPRPAWRCLMRPLGSQEAEREQQGNLWPQKTPSFHSSGGASSGFTLRPHRSTRAGGGVR